MQAVNDYAAAHKIKIVEVYRDEGVSGTKAIDERPAFIAMSTALRSGDVGIVLIEKLDRLARDLFMQEAIFGILQKQRVRLVSTMEPDLCSDDPTRVMVRQLFGMVAQYEKSTLVAKLKGARQRIRAKTGRCEGRKPYGARAGESQVIQRMRAMRESGATWKTVAETLNDEGVKARVGKWHANSVRRIVTY